MSAIFLDSSVLIRHFRDQNKINSFYTQIRSAYDKLYMSAIAKAEIFSYIKDNDIEYWNIIFKNIRVFPFTENTIVKTREIALQLKRKSMLIELADMMIAATAIENDFPLATINQSHFERIDRLKLITPELPELFVP
ncbi:MAG: type II toxin-antitoxin system VapC family toxin [Planctomycetaceae bacterium]|jgi:predicted nucleic acid-binding protein|nr:type II toxin-antitoxin system VapC family toxin [Planctomycetaceae bacterium]